MLRSKLAAPPLTWTTPKPRPKSVLVPARERLVDGDAAVDAEAHKIAVLERREHRPDERAHVADAIRRAPNHLVGERVNGIVAVMRRGGSVAQGTGEGQAHIVVLLVVERLAVVPAPILYVPGGAVRVGLVRVDSAVERILQFGDRHDAIQREADAALIAELAAVRAGRERAAAVDARERRHRVANLKLAADAEARERIGRAAAGQID